ncbi:hypothetical protein N7495_009979 [Penicillium taxi]|uniref:uncharacterized protein n=1 Tax=Penicillium taxi TaxID=168475 RepID=UPI0025452399|nr:uncharacterized protein N7495_009979 [Penicillium taxi]KAJ5885469.1 hypothetical protein N7495_009979 [Penicillium taxi]
MRIHEPLDQSLLERAYRDTIVQRMMTADGKQPAQKFNRSDFKIAVNQYYGVSRDGMTFCHDLGRWLTKDKVKAAHIIPKGMSPGELSHIFGDNDTVATLPENGKTP